MLGTMNICHKETANTLFYLENTGYIFFCIGICSCKEANFCLSLTGGGGSKNVQSIFKSTMLCYFLSGRLNSFSFIKRQS